MCLLSRCICTRLRQTNSFHSTLGFCSNSRMCRKHGGGTSYTCNPAHSCFLGSHQAGSWPPRGSGLCGSFFELLRPLFWCVWGEFLLGPSLKNRKASTGASSGAGGSARRGSPGGGARRAAPGGALRHFLPRRRGTARVGRFVTEGNP